MNLKINFFRFPLAALLLVSLIGCRPQQKEAKPTLISINIIDENGLTETISNAERLKRFENTDFLASQPYQKVSRVYSRNAEGDICAYITSYHSNGGAKQYLEVVNGRAFGVYREWHFNGILKIDAIVIGGSGDLDTGAVKSWLFDGACRAWNEEGALQASILYSKGELEGTSLYFHCNGTVWKKSPFHANKMEGVEEVFLENGHLFQTTSYCSGEKQGPSKKYWCDGSVAAEEFFEKNRLMKGLYYDRQGALISEIDCGAGFRAIFGKDSLSELQEYRHGFQEGVVKVFGRDGIILKSYWMKNGCKHGEEIEYFPYTSQEKLSISWSEGMIQGMVKTWYPSGFQESQREMTANKKNGLLTAWFADGSLMLIEQYDNDKLVKGEYYKKGDQFPLSTVIDGKGTASLFDSDGTFLRKVYYRFGLPDDS